MRIFLSYATEDRHRAEQIQFALRGAGHDVFFDKESLPVGGEYHVRIKAAVEQSDIFIFLISPDSISPKRYTLTELKYAREKWPNANGYLLPVILRDVSWKEIPNYLKSVTILEPEGDVAAEVVASLSNSYRADQLKSQVSDQVKQVAAQVFREAGKLGAKGSAYVKERASQVYEVASSETSVNRIRQIRYYGCIFISVLLVLLGIFWIGYGLRQELHIAAKVFLFTLGSGSVVAGIRFYNYAKTKWGQ